METVFKEGIKVYDQLNFPNKKGVIVEISNDENDPYPVEVSFENEVGRYYFTPEGHFNKKHIPTLSTKPYEVVLEGFEQKAPAPTYEEAEEWIRKEYAKGNNYLMMKDVLEALRKLIILRDYYNEGWQPDWKNPDVIKHTLEVFANELKRSGNYTLQKLLVFKTKEIRDRFFEEQKELLEIAKPLL